MIDDDDWIGLSWPNENLETFRHPGLYPYPPTSWLPASDAKWMTPAESAAFEADGGWARFDAAGWDDPSRPRSKF